VVCDVSVTLTYGNLVFLAEISLNARNTSPQKKNQKGRGKKKERAREKRINKRRGNKR
jgi:hypothetical protein